MHHKDAGPKRHLWTFGELESRFRSKWKNSSEMRSSYVTITSQRYYVKQDSPLPFSTTSATSFSSILDKHSPVLLSTLNIGQTHWGHLLNRTMLYIDGFWTINLGSILWEYSFRICGQGCCRQHPKDAFSKKLHLGEMFVFLNLSPRFVRWFRRNGLSHL